MAEIWLTQEEYDRRQKQLDYLKGEKTLEIAEHLKVARAFGDLSENAEYDAAKDEQAKNALDIKNLEEELRVAKIIGKDGDITAEAGSIKIGDVVVVEMAGVERQFTITGSAEADPASGRISNESPIGQALLGMKVGQSVDVQTPGGVILLKVAKVGK